MKIATWNVNSIKARYQRVMNWLQTHEPDILCLQEIKTIEQAFPSKAFKEKGYYASVYGQPTYHGVAILSKSKPKSIQKGFENSEKEQARFMYVTIKDIIVMSVYFPNGETIHSDKYLYKIKWIQKLKHYISNNLHPKKNAIALCGDFNIAPSDHDLYSPQAFQDSVLTTSEMRCLLDDVVQLGFSDVVLPFYPKGHVYSWWDYRHRSFEKNHGARIDHIFCTQALKITGALIDKKERKGKGASDHVPIMIEIDE